MLTSIRNFALLSLMTFAGACATTQPSTPAAPSLQVDGDLPTRSFSVEELQALSPTEVRWTHNEKTHVFTAVPLDALLHASGFDPGSMKDVAPKDKRKGWKLALVATATDGFQAVFSAAEVSRGMGRTDAFVAFREDGKPIDAQNGPLRLVVTSDGEASRSLRNLVRLTVVDLRRIVPSNP